jgi:hypothetical protein
LVAGRKAGPEEKRGRRREARQQAKRKKEEGGLGCWTERERRGKRVGVLGFSFFFKTLFQRFKTFKLLKLHTSNINIMQSK